MYETSVFKSHELKRGPPVPGVAVASATSRNTRSGLMPRLGQAASTERFPLQQKSMPCRGNTAGARKSLATISRTVMSSVAVIGGPPRHKDSEPAIDRI